MMPSPDKPVYDDQLVVQYLLGSISEEETVRLDAWSIANDEFAERLRAAENDLVDAYVRGGLSGESLERFQSHYLASPYRRERVRFAESLLALCDRAPVAFRRNERTGRWWGRWWAFSPAWTFAAVLCLMLLAGGYLLYDNSRLRDQVTRAEVDREALQQSHQILQRQIQEQRIPAAEVPASQPPAQNPASAMALVLLPQTRGSGPLTTIALLPAADQAMFQLELESGDFDSYQAVLKDPATGRTVWSSGKLKAASRGDSKRVSISLPTGLLNAQNYVLDLFGVPRAGAGEFLSSYAFRVVR
jgi:hypothetical protein